MMEYLFEPLYKQEGWQPSSVPVLPFAIGVVLAMWTFNTYLDFRQHGKYSETSFPESLASLLREMDEEAAAARQAGPSDCTAAGDAAETQPSMYQRTLAAFEKSQAYGHAKSTFGFVAGSIDTLITVAGFATGMYPWLWDVGECLATWVGLPASNELVASCAFLVVFYVVSTVLSLPFGLYRVFVLEEAFGFNEQTWQTYFGDLLKSSLLSALIGLPITCLLITIIQSTGDYFWLYCWLFMFAVVLFLMTIYPNVIAPCFNTFTPLQDGPLRDRIEALASRLKFPLRKLFVVDGSRHSAHSNAYMYGFCNNKRIVLFDTLIKQATPAEIEAVLGHELGHWKHGHTLFMMVISQTMLLLQFFLFGLFIHRTQLLDSFGFGQNCHPTILSLLLFFEVAFSPLAPLLSFGKNALSRHFEFQADAFAANLGYTKSLQSGLVKLQVENLGSLCVDPLYSAYHYSHPPLVERLEALRQLEGSKKQD